MAEQLSIQELHNKISSLLNDPTFLKDKYSSDSDVYKKLASGVFEVQLEDVTEDQVHTVSHFITLG